MDRLREPPLAEVLIRQRLAAAAPAAAPAAPAADKVRTVEVCVHHTAPYASPSPIVCPINLMSGRGHNKHASKREPPSAGNADPTPLPTATGRLHHVSVMEPRRLQRTWVKGSVFLSVLGLMGTSSENLFTSLGKFARPGVVGFEKKVLRQATVVPGDALQLHHGGASVDGGVSGVPRGGRATVDVLLVLLLMMVVLVLTARAGKGPRAYRRSRLPCCCCSAASSPVADEASTAAEPPSPSRTAVAVLSKFVLLFLSSLLLLLLLLLAKVLPLARRRCCSGTSGGTEPFDPSRPVSSSSAVSRARSASRPGGKPLAVRFDDRRTPPARDDGFF
uniref:Uncharacterized protein n=1 Tax=Anopheles atroparvus TaxID=41427 RepID=A0A182IP08_ANOAO